MSVRRSVVVGAGPAGCTMARGLAERGWQVLLLDRRAHLGGNAYDERDERGILVQRYGPHLFHTSDEELYRWITRFCEPESFKPGTAAVINGISTPSPFNFRTIDQFYPPRQAAALKEGLLRQYPGQDAVPVLRLMQSEDAEIRAFADFLFRNDFQPYTARQWGVSPEEVDPSVLARVPVLLSYAGRYTDRWQFTPRGGFTAFFAQMTEHPNITLQLGTDARDHLEADDARGVMLFDGDTPEVIYTGPLDELFGRRYGALPYRSLRFEHQLLPRAEYQEAAVTAYPQAEGYTRITEYTKLPPQQGGGWTHIAREYPLAYRPEEGMEPFYPVRNAESEALCARYQALAARYANLRLLGRLAEFRYVEMHEVMRGALDLLKTMEEEIHGKGI